MPIAVSCPSCSGSFKVKDEYAGKRAKCPKCGEPLTIPAADVEMADDEPAPAPARTAKPVAAKKPKPAVVDDEDDAPKPAKKRRTVEEDEDDRPKKKSRSKSEDEDDEKPKGKRKGAKSAEKKGLPLPLLIGMIAGVVVLLGVGIAVAVALSQGPGQANATGQPPAPPTGRGGPVPDLTPTPKPSGTQPAFQLTAADLSEELQSNWQGGVAKYNGKVVQLTGVAAIAGTQTEVLMLADRTPAGGGTAFSCYLAADQKSDGLRVAAKAQVTLVGTVEFTHNGRQFNLKNCRVLSTAGTAGGNPPTPPTENPVGVTADALIDEILADESAFEVKYKGKMVTVTATLSQVSPISVTVQRTVDRGLVNITGEFKDGPPKEMRVGATVTYTGRVWRVIKGQYKSVDIEECRLVPGSVNPAPSSGGSVLGEAVSFVGIDDAVRDAAKHHDKFVVVTGTAAADVSAGARLGDIAVTQSGGKAVRFSFRSDAAPTAIKKGQAVEIWGHVLVNAQDKAVSLRDCVLLTPAVELKVSDLVAAYQKDAKVAVAQYSSSAYKFTAKVRSVEFGNVVLDDGGAVTVTPSFSTSADLLRIKKGDTITFFGSPGVLFNDPKLGSVLLVSDCKLPPAKAK